MRERGDLGRLLRRGAELDLERLGRAHHAGDDDLLRVIFETLDKRYVIVDLRQQRRRIVRVAAALRADLVHRARVRAALVARDAEARAPERLQHAVRAGGGVQHVATLEERAVVLVGEEHDREVRILAQEVRVDARHQCALDGLELLFEAAALIAERRHLGEHVGEGAGVVLHAAALGSALHVADKRAHERRACHADLELAVLATARVAAGRLPRRHRLGRAATAEIARDHADVQVGEAALDRREDADEVPEVRLQVRLLVGHRVRVIDHEQDVDVPVHGDRDVLVLDAALGRIDFGDRAVGTAGEQGGGDEGRAEQGIAKHHFGNLQRKLTKHRASAPPA